MGVLISMILFKGKKEENVLKVICDVIFNQSIYQIKSINISNQSFHQSMCWKPSKNYSLVLSIFNVTNNKHFFVFKKINSLKNCQYIFCIVNYIILIFDYNILTINPLAVGFSITKPIMV